MLKCIVTFSCDIFKIKLACQDGATEVNNTESQAKTSSRCILLSFEGDISTF